MGKNISFITAFWLLTITALAQSTYPKVVEYDSITGKPSQQFPFDEEFIIKIPIKSQRVASFYRVEIKNNQTFASAFAKEGQRKKFLPNSFEVKTGKVNYLIAVVDGDFKLEPGRKYAFFWSGDVNDNVLEVFDAYHEYRKGSTPISAVAPSYTKVSDFYKNKFGFQLGFVAAEIGTYNFSLKQWYDAPSYNALDVAESTYTSALPTFIAPLPATKTALQALIRLIIQRSDQFDTKWKNIYLPDARKAERRLLKLMTLDALTFNRLILGQEGIDCFDCTLTANRQYESRQTNIKATATAIDELYTVAASLEVANPAVTPATIYLKSYATYFQSATKKIALLVKARKEVKDKIFDLGISGLDRASGDANVYGFEARNKISIAPDFGFALTPFNNKTNPYPFLPYLGFHVNLRPLNRDVPFNSYTHRGLNRWSLMVAWTLVNIDNGPKRTANVNQDSIASFFNAKGTLLTGVGFRLGNAVRITSGTAWYFKYQLNDANVPLVYNDRKAKVWPFVGVAVDLALKDLLNGISDVFTGTARNYVAPPAPVPVTASE